MRTSITKDIASISSICDFKVCRNDIFGTCPGILCQSAIQMVICCIEF